jgi:hypothetical protein
MSNRRAKVPLSSAKVTRLRDEVETLIQVAHLDAEPASLLSLRERGDRRAVADLARAIGPTNRNGPEPSRQVGIIPLESVC